jgi:hypothetical protein
MCGARCTLTPLAVPQARSPLGGTRGATGGGPPGEILLDHQRVQQCAPGAQDLPLGVRRGSVSAREMEAIYREERVTR